MSTIQRLTVQAIIHGRVQGVGYRHWAWQQACKLGLHGWVANQPDGTVKIVLSGAENQVAAMLDLCRQGPKLANVTHLAHETVVVDIKPGFAVVRLDDNGEPVPL